MAQKITVVLSQSPQVVAARRDLEESLVAALLLERGVDITVVPHLEHLDQDATGLLCLERLPGNLAVLTWLSPEAAFAELQRWGIRGVRGATALGGAVDRPAPSSGGGSSRRLYLLDLRAAPDPKPYIAEVLRLRDEVNVETVSLLGLDGIPTPPAPAHGKTNGAPSAAKEKPATTPARPNPAQAAPPTPDRSSRAGDPDFDPDVEDLLDQFDRLEL